jgi:hypothetical protein
VPTRPLDAAYYAALTRKIECSPRERGPADRAMRSRLLLNDARAGAGGADAAAAASARAELTHGAYAVAFRRLGAQVVVGTSPRGAPILQMANAGGLLAHLLPLGDAALPVSARAGGERSEPPERA